MPYRGAIGDNRLVRSSTPQSSSAARRRRRRKAQAHNRSHESGHDAAAPRPLLSPAAIDTALQALSEVDSTGVGRHIGIAAMTADSATHRFEALVPGYRGWEWHIVLAHAPGTDYVTVSEIAMVPAEQALTPPSWLPYDQRIQPGDLGPGDILPPGPHDPRLRDGQLSSHGLAAAHQRWRTGDYGPQSPMAIEAPLSCHSCAFYLPLSKNFGVCANEFSADGRVVHSRYGCGAHSRTTVADPDAQPAPAFDDEKPVY